MTAGEYDIIIEQGATFQRTFTYRDSDNALVNLTGYTARMHIRAKVSDPYALVTLTTENGGITLGGAAGTIAVAISATATADISAPHGVYDLELISGSGHVTRLLQGKVTFSPEVTR